MCNAPVLIAIMIIINQCAASFRCDTVSYKPFVVERCTSWYDNGIIEIAYETVDGEFNGIYTSWYKSGKIESKLSYRRGCVIDSGFSFFNSGKIKSISYKKDCKTRGYSIEFFENGDTAQINTPAKLCSFYSNRHFANIIHYNSSGQKHGLSEHFREDGTRKDSIVYRNDSLVIERQYFLNGKLRHYVKYDKHENIDTLFCYHPDSGRTMGEVIHGNGSVFHFSENGKEAMLFKYENGKEAGAIPVEDLKKALKK